MSDKRLLPCPFCGGEAECYTVQTIQMETGFVVKCKNLDCIMCSGGTLRQKPYLAIEAWNTRIPMQNIVERLEKEGQKMSEAKSMIKYGKASPSNHRYYKAISVKKAIEIVKGEKTNE